MPLTQEQWTAMQNENPEQWGGYQAISGEQYANPDQQGWWQNVQQVGEGPGATLYGMPGSGEISGVPPPTDTPTPTPAPVATTDTTQETTTDTTTDTTEEDEESFPGEEQYKEDREELILLQEQIENNLDDFATTMDENSKALIESIKAKYNVRRQQMEALNRRTLKGYTSAGIRSGRQRYAPEIQGGILSAQESAGISRLAQLDAEEQSLILQAKMASDEKQFEILQAKSENLIKIQEQKMQTILDLNSLAYQEEERMRARMTFDRQKSTWNKEDASTRLESMLTGGIDLNALSDEEYTKLETDLGLMEGTLEGFYTGLQDAQAAEAVGDEIKLQQSIVSLLNSTPEGMEITIGDKTYQGLKDTVDRMSYTYTDAANNKKYEIVIDKKTGEELYRKDMGQAYKPTQGPAPAKVSESLATKLGIPISYIGTAINNLPQEYKDMVLEGDTGDITNSERKNELVGYIEEQNLIGNDEKVSWETYLAMKQTWINNGGNDTTFKTNFPIGTWLDEDNQEELATQLTGE